MAPPRPQSPPRPVVFLDRDDTLNRNAELPPAAFPGTRGDLFLPEHVQLFPGVADACQRLKSAGYALVIVTNQACVARGHATLADVERTNQAVAHALGPGVIDACYSATFHPSAVVPHLRSRAEADHPWRKPGPGMLLAAAHDLHLDLGRAWIIGDKTRDVDAGLAAGLPRARCLRIGPPHAPDPTSDFPDTPSAAEHILAQGPAHELPSSLAPPSSLAATRSPPAAAPPASPPPMVLRPATTVTLRTTDGTHPLRDADVRRNVEAAAHAIAERTGVELLALALAPTGDALAATLATHRLAATAFAAELRRHTNHWHQQHRGTPLWPASTDAE